MSKNVANDSSAAVFGNSITVQDVYATRVHSDTLLPISTSNINVTGNIVPTVTSTYTLGDGVNTWQNGIFDATEVRGNLYVVDVYGSTGTINVFNTVLPGDVNVDIGSAGSKFRNTYATGTVEGATTKTGSVVPVSGSNISVGGHLLPSSNNTYDIGSASFKFRDGFTAGTVEGATTKTGSVVPVSGSDISVGGNLIPSANNMYDLGSTGSKFKNGYTNGTMELSTVKTSSIIPVATNITVGGNLIPTADNTYDLGSASVKWKEVDSRRMDCADNFNVNFVTSTGSSVVFDTNIEPWADNTYRSGDFTKRWSTGHTVDANTSRVISPSTLTLQPAGASNILVAANVVPTASATYNMGSGSATFASTFSDRLLNKSTEGATTYSVASDGSPVTIGTSNTDLTPTITATEFSDSGYFKFPTKGYYIISGNLIMKTNLPDTNSVKIAIRLYNSSFTFVETQQQTLIRLTAGGGTPYQYALVVNIADVANDRIRLGVSLAGGATSADVYVTVGRITACTAYY